MRRRTWLALAALLLAAAAGLLALVEEPPERPLAPVAFPRRLREAERRRVTERRTLPPAAAPATAAPGAEPSPPAPRRDPFLTALPAAPGEPVVIFEANALRHSRLGELFIRCALAKDPDFFAGLSRETGLDVLKDVDRVGFAGDAVVISGTFDAAHWERLEQQAEATPYGDEGRLYRDRGKAGAPVLARWRDQVVVFSPDEAAARLAVDQLEGRAEAPPPLDGDLAYGEVYGVIPAAAEQAWRAEPGAFHLLLTDLVMPGGTSGLELVRRLRAEDPGLPALVMSGHGPDLAAGLPTGVGFLPKPWAPEELARAIHRELRRRPGAGG